MLITILVLHDKCQDASFHIFIELRCFISLQNICWILFQTCLLQHVLRNIFKFLVFRWLENLFCKSNNWKYTYLLMYPHAKLSPSSYHYMQNSLSSPPTHPLRQREIAHSSSPCSIFLKICFIKVRTLLSFARYIFDWEDSYIVHPSSMLYFIWCICQTCGLDFNWLKIKL